jgi:hypothetical protein
MGGSRLRDLFPGYYQWTKKDLDTLWNEGLIILDTNILLNLYRYSKSTRDNLLQVIRQIKDRLWLPHEIAKEFQEKRLERVYAERKNCDNWLDELRSTLNKLDEARRHPFVTDKLRKKLQTLVDELQAEIGLTVKELDGFKREDPIFDELTRLFEQKVGPAPTDKEREEMLADGENRYRKRIPPGFEDRKKGDERRFADLVIWKQILAKAAVDKVPVLFVTDDAKADWWREIQGETIGPHPSLVAEIVQKSPKAFHMYSGLRFLEYAAKHFEKVVEGKALEEVRKADQQSAERWQDDLLSISKELEELDAYTQQVAVEQGALWREFDEERRRDSGSISRLVEIHKRLQLLRSAKASRLALLTDRLQRHKFSLPMNEYHKLKTIWNRGTSDEFTIYQVGEELKRRGVE